MLSKHQSLKLLARGREVEGRSHTGPLDREQLDNLTKCETAIAAFEQATGSFSLSPSPSAATTAARRRRRRATANPADKLHG